VRHSDSISPDYHNPRIVNITGCNAYDATIVWAPTKSLWFVSMALVGILGGYYTASIETLVVFLVTTTITLCFGHSLGMHRRFIHHSYECKKWVEYLFVYLGVLVGLAGPFGMMYTHDLRDWAQRQKKSHAYFGHKSSLLSDFFWQIHCDIELKHPPVFKLDASIRNSKFYHYLEKYWMFQQAPIALVLYLLGGIEWVIWGVCLRLTASITGHWLIGYFAHNKGQSDWHVKGASVQGFNIKFCGLITMGECWHNNHHAFPDSALLGIKSNQVDPGWWVLQLMEKLDLVWELKTPDDLPARAELVPSGTHH